MVQQMDQLQQDLVTLAKIEELSQQLKVERQVLCLHAYLDTLPTCTTIGVLCCMVDVVGPGLCHPGDLVQSY